MPTHADVVIVGGGVMGVSIAFHLARAGAGRVVMLEKRWIGAGSSGKSGAIVRQHYSTDLLVRMAGHGLDTFRTFVSVTGGRSGWNNSGCLIVGGPTHRAGIEHNVGLMHSAQVDTEIIRPGDAASQFTQFAFGEDDVCAWEPHAGTLDPPQVLRGFANAATAAGAHIREGVTATELSIHRGRIEGVHTSNESFRSECVVLCAGPWSARLAARSGISLPLTAVRPEIALFRHEGLTRETPVIADLRSGFYLRPDHESAKHWFGLLDNSMDEVITDPDNAQESIGSSFPPAMRELAVKRVPNLGSATSFGGFSGLYTMSPDGHPLIGPDPTTLGLILAVGFSGHGFKLSPAVGRAIAEMITTGASRSLDLQQLRPSRFLEGQPIASSYHTKVLS